MKMNSPERYPADVFWSDEDEGFIALARDLPGCSAWGVTQAEAIGELQDAISAWIEAAMAAGNPIPAPSKPAEEKRYAGKILIRVPHQLHASLAKEAESEDVSLNQYILYLLAMNNAVSNIDRKIAVTASIASMQSNFFVYYGQTQNVFRGSTNYPASGIITFYGDPVTPEVQNNITVQTPALAGPGYRRES